MFFFNCVSVILGFPSQIFNFNRKPADEDKDDDLSDSEDSVYSGLEDSGSDAEGEEGSEEEEEDDDDDKVQCQQLSFNCICLTADWLLLSVLSVLLQNIT